MRISIISLVLAVCVVLGVTAFNNPFEGVEDKCNSREAINRCDSKLPPFYYSSAKISNLFFLDYSYEREIEVRLFEGEEYILVFNNEFLPLEVEVNIYDKPKTEPDREALMSYKDLTDKSLFSFKPPQKNRVLYVEYNVPPGPQDKILKGCAAFVLGYKMDF